MYTVYVIVSLVSDRFYVGQTDNLLYRYRKHADGKVKSTTSLRPHVIGHVEICHSRSEAMRRERQLKEHAGRGWIRQAIIPLVREYYPA